MACHAPTFFQRLIHSFPAAFAIRSASGSARSPASAAAPCRSWRKVRQAYSWHWPQRSRFSFPAQAALPASHPASIAAASHLIVPFFNLITVVYAASSTQKP